ncbi:FG-GAP-like repeat-containing protein [Chloroflexus sp.]|uniref:FG-GAP-like repeat-containing protein n=1 Tax=Chloroflexus sp. TaxID=1904827 RepID=UPI002607D9E7|nr:FG-GAP-like repeat-containing protein [uncultured Chloroflexus sp.]
MTRYFCALCLLLFISLASGVTHPLYGQERAGLLRQVWQSAVSDAFTAIAAFDIDADGDDDLAVGRRNAPTQIWRNDGLNAGGQPVFTPVWSAPIGRDTVALAWTVTSGGALLLAEANYGDVSVMYRVTSLSSGIAVTVQFVTQSFFAQTIVWGQIDGDSEPDLLIGGELEPIYLYSGTTILAGGPDTPSVVVPGTFTVSSLALAEMNGDSQLDLVVGLRNDSTRIFAGQLVAPFFASAPFWIDDAINFNTRAVVAADFDGNGRNDLFIASVRENNRLYLHQSDVPFTLSLSWVSDQRINAIAAAAADFNGDGLLDLMLSSEPRSDVIQTLPIGEHLLRNNGVGGFTLVETFANRSTNVSNLVWGQLVGGSMPDLAVVRFGAPARIYQNELSGAVLASVTGASGAPARGALFFRQPAGSAALGQIIIDDDRPLRTDTAGSVNLTGYVNNNDRVAVLEPVGELRAFASTHGPIAIDADQPDRITATLTVTQTGIIQFIDTVAITGTHTYFSDLSMTLISPSGTMIRLLDGICGAADGFALVLNDAAPGISCPPVGGAVSRAIDPLDELRSEPITGVWQLVIEDDFAFDGGALESWSISALINDIPLYYTNFTPGDPPVLDTVNDGVANAFSTSAANPLLLFDIDVSLEWDARNDTSYLSQLSFDLYRVSELLYDWTNGQAALGRVRLFHNRERWNQADVRIYASNRLRPNSDRGGIVQQTTITTNGNGDEEVFYPGRVRIGATWNQYGASRGTIGEDWPRALAHELGHYLFFLSDNYIGFDNAGGRKVLVGIDGCAGAMNNPYREEESEFHPQNLAWETLCANTLSQLETGRADWDTIVAFYPPLAAYRPTTLNQITGPNTLPVNLTEILEMPLTERVRAVRQSTFSLLLAFGSDTIRLQPDRSARGILFTDDDGNGVIDRLIDLGAPVRDQLEARGARPGDRLCLFEPAARRLGCVESIVAGQTTLTVTERSDWQPDIRIEPLDGQRIRVIARVGGIDAPLRARLFPLDGAPSAVVTLTITGETAQAEIMVPAPFDQALLQLWVDEPAPRRETVTDVSLYYYPEDTPRLADSESPVLSQRRPCNPRLQTCPRDAPASLDGQAMIYDLDGVFGPGDLISFQAATRPPAAPPPWTEPVGSGYWLNGVSVTQLEGFSINLSYDEASLPPGTAGGLSIFTYNPTEQTWREIVVRRRDRERRELSGDSAGAGFYTLLTTLRPSPGWNLLAYPWAGETVPVAFNRLNVDTRHYRIVYGYDDVNSRWLRYDPTVTLAFAPFVNTLTSLVYGRGYWVFVTEPGPTGAAAPASAPALQSALPQPPTTYYGYIAPLGNTTFSAGQTVEALINGAVCGSGQTQLINGQIGYVIDVAAAQPGMENCGLAGRQVTFRVNGLDVRGTTIWGLPGAHRLDLNPTIWLPFTSRALVCLVACS